jgi:hypothetical protein
VLPQVDVGSVECPLRNRFNFDVEVGVEGIDALGQVEVDDHAVVQAEGAAEGVERDLEPAVQVAPVRGFEVEGQVDAEEGAFQGGLDAGRDDLIHASALHELGNVSVESLRGFAEDAALADRDVLVVDSRREAEHQVDRDRLAIRAHAFPGGLPSVVGW